MKAVAKAPANIALIKFWGKRDENLRLPKNSSISINLSEIFTVTSVDFSGGLDDDGVVIDGIKVDGKEKERVITHIDRIRKMAGIKSKVAVSSRNNFPKGTGLASSASGFAALSLAATKAAGLELDERYLSILARLGSGSACRSIPDGWVEWKEGDTSDKSYAHSLFGTNYWDVCDVVVVVGSFGKKVSSTEGHALVESSPFYTSRIKGMKQKIADIKRAIKSKDFTKMGEILETEAINMHVVMMTSGPSLFYWSPKTLEVMLLVQEWRGNGLESYFTIDAGPNVHLICMKKDVNKLKMKLSMIEGIEKMIVNGVANGARLV